MIPPTPGLPPPHRQHEVPPVHPARLGLGKEEWQALLRPRTLPTLLRIIVVLLPWLGLAYIAHRIEPLWAKLGLWLLAGFFVNGFIQFGHETWHHNLFASKRANLVFGHFLGWLVGIGYEPMRHDHLLHHKWNRTPRDPDAYNAGTLSFATVAQFYGVAFIGIPLAVLFFNFLYPIVFMDAKERTRHFRQLAVYAAVHVLVWTVLVLTGGFGLARDLWLMPLLFASPWNGLKSISDHYANVWEGDRYHTATSVRSNAFVRYFWSGLNYHLDHHLYPRVPGPHLPRLHTLLRPYLLAQGSPVFSSYLSVWIKALRAGPTYTERDHFLRAPGRGD